MKTNIKWIFGLLFLLLVIPGTESKADPLIIQADRAILTDAGINVVYSPFHYLHVAGSTLRPRNSISTWASSGDGGCIYATANPGIVYNLDLQLPMGARIDYLRIYYYDTSASDSNAWVTIYNDSGGLTDITSVSSSGTSGYGTNLSAYIGHVVNNSDYSYVLNWRPNVDGNTNRLCGLRVAYRIALDKTVFLPMVIK